MRVIQLSVGDTAVLVAPEHGGRLASITHRGVETLIGPSHAPGEVLGWGCYPMVPWCGRIANGRFVWNGRDIRLDRNNGLHALHGTTFDTAWDVIDLSDDAVVMTAPIDGKGWPFSGQVTHSVSVADGVVRMALEVAVDEPAPVQVGWHPWFVKPSALSTTFTSMYVRAPDHATTAQTVAPKPPPWDDCFTNGEVEPFLLGDVSVALESSCQHWVIYDEPTYATCIEPQSGPPNGVNIGVIDVVTPDEPMRHLFAIQLS